MDLERGEDDFAEGSQVQEPKQMLMASGKSPEKQSMLPNMAPLTVASSQANPEGTEPCNFQSHM